MTLASRIALLAHRIGLELKTRIDTTHPGLAKVWVCFGYVGNQLIIRASYNVARVTRLAAGRYRVTFVKPMSNANYCWTALARSSTNSGMQRIAIVRPGTDQKTPQYVDISCATTTTTFDDSTEINLVVFG